MILKEQFLIWDGVVILKEQFLLWEGVVALRKLIFNNFYFWMV